MRAAEIKYREALKRLVAGEPTVVDRGAAVTQNNVAREAGVDPSALRRSRYPELVADIQAAGKDVGSEKGRGARATSRNRRTAEQINSNMREERDHAVALLASADDEVLRLMRLVRALEERLSELSGGAPSAPSYPKRAGRGR